MIFAADLHTHTLASDHAYSTLQEVADYAASIGLPMIACTDHGPALADAPHPWHFGNIRVVPRFIHGTAVLRGIEANIMADGTLDIADFIRERLDIVLAGFHPNLDPKDKATHTALMIKIIESGKVDIIAHPGNPSYPIDAAAVLECAKANNVAVEINASSSINTRMGSHANCVAIAKLAAKIGNKVSIGTDAHIAFYAGCFEPALEIIKEADLSFDQVICTSVPKVLDFLESRGHAPIPEFRAKFGY